MLDLHNLHKGERAFIVGSGPSLEQQADLLGGLDDEIVFSCNKLPRWEECPFQSMYHCITEPNHLDHMGRHDCPDWRDTRKFALHWSPTWHLKPVEKDGWRWIAKAPDDVQIRYHGFQGLGDELLPFPTGYMSPLTITQLAAWMGIEQFIFLGIDMTDEGYVFTGFERRSVHPRTLKGIMECFVRANDEVSAAGREMIDCTPGGLINARGILPYKELEEVL